MTALIIAIPAAAAVGFIAAAALCIGKAADAWDDGYAAAKSKTVEGRLRALRDDLAAIERRRGAGE